MYKKIFSIFLILILSVSSIFAQEESEDWYWNQPISEIDFEGLVNVRKADLIGVTSFYIGKPFTEETYTGILDRLYALDMFDDIEPYAKHASTGDKDVLLVFKVTEKPVINEVNFSGNKKVRNGELRDLIKTKKSDIYVQSKVLLDERILRDHLLKKGYTDSSVTHKVEKTPEGVNVTFVINEGNNTVISKINIVGNTIVSERALKGKLELKEVGLFTEGAFQSAVLEMDKKIILNYYKERGYIDAAIVDTKIESAYNEEKQRNELIITFVIQEGSQYIYTGMEIVGNEVFSTEKLMSLMKLKPGSIFNDVKFQEGISAIMGLYYENGYMSNEFYPMPKKDAERKEISYILTIKESARSHIENIIIKGNSKTKDFVIRRELPIEEGDVFSRDKIISGMRNLMNLQYFSNVVPEPQSGSEQNLVDLVFSVEEQSTTALQFGMTFSGVTDPDAIPISLYAKLENSNLFGEGKSISASTTISTNEQSVDFTYSQNWIGKLPIAFSQSLAFSHASSYAQNNMFLPDLSLNQYNYYMAYEAWSASLNTAFSRRWFPKFAIVTATVGLTDSLTRYNFNETTFTPTDLGISIFANRLGILNSIWSGVSLDNRDLNYDPSKGWFASERLSWNGLLPGIEKEFFLKSDTKLEGYLTLFNVPVTEKWNFKGVFAAYTGFSALFPTPNTVITESNKLYIDGMFNGRGWTRAHKNADGKGQAMWSNSLELRFPVAQNILGVDAFFDAVAIKSDVKTMFTDLSIEDFYFSFGPGIRVLMPQLPLHFLFAFKYRIVDGKPQWAESPFEFVLSFNIVNR